jgi:hypothetical protein
MDIPYYKLNIDVKDAIKPDFDLSAFGIEKDWVWPFFDNDIKDIFNPQWIQYMSDMGLNIREGTIFYKIPNLPATSHIHIDSIPKNPWKLCYYGINWLMDLQHVSPKFAKTSTIDNNEDDSTMLWYHQSDQPIRKLTIKQDGHDRIVNYFSAEYKSISHRLSVGKDVYMVRTSTPHTVETKTSNRLAMSLRNVFDDDYDLDWDTMVEKIRPWII